MPEQEHDSSVFGVCRNELRQIEAFVLVYRSGISTASWASSFMEIDRVMGSVIGEPSKYDDAALNRARRAKALADSEMEPGFPYLHGMAVIRAWSALEAHVSRLFAETIANCGSSDQRSKSVWSDLVGDAQLSAAERKDQLLRIVFDWVAVRRRSGLRKYAFVLGLVEFELEPWKERRLYELSSCRNLIVHKAGIVDSRFRRSWSSRREVVGDTLNLQDYEIRNFLRAAYWYLVETRCQGPCNDLDADKLRDHRHFQAEVVRLVRQDAE